MLYSLKEIAGSSYYRTRPFASLQFLYSKWEFARRRVANPADMLEMMGLDSATALRSFDKWSETLMRIVSEAGREPGQGGINMPEGKFLFGITRALKPKIIIETGVAAGVSSCFFIAALLENEMGELYSLDLPIDAAKLSCADASQYTWPVKGAGWVIPSDMRTRIGARHHLILEDVRSALPRLLNEIGSVDIFFHDDLHLPEHMFWEYSSVWTVLTEGGVLASHDVNMGWIRFCRQYGIPSSRLMNLNRLCAVRKSTDRSKSL